jgi:lysophospholipase L1-like esterase
VNRWGFTVLALGVLGAACSEQVESTVGTVPVSTSSVVVETSAATTTVPPSTAATSTSTTTTSTTSTSTTSTTTTTVVPTTTSCDQVVHIGDSTSVSLFDAASVGGAGLTGTAQYQRVGVVDIYPDNDGARSMVERAEGRPNAIDVAQGVRDNGYDGCWVLMIGTNDAANIAAGSNTNAETRIRSMMQVIGDDPVLWVDAVTQRTDDAYRNASMVAWNQELYRVTAEFPNVRVFRWFEVVRPEWFRNDGIHYTVEGSAQRATLTADALVTFFPAA